MTDKNSPAAPPSPEAAADKKGEALKQQRFRMLEDIAREMSSDDIVFPTCFDAVLRIRDALKDPEVSIQKVIALVRTEPLICARLLQLANSAVQGVREEIRDVGTAVQRLGLNAVRNAAMTVAMAQLVRSKALLPFNSLSRALWLHSLYAAAAAEVIAAEMSRVSPDEALFAGLVHDLGAFYMLYRAAQYDELRVRPDTVRHLIMQWHQDIGESLLYALKLPDGLIEALRNHDQARPPLLDPARKLGEVVYAANVLASTEFAWVESEEDEPRELGAEFHALKPRIDERFAQIKSDFG